MYHITPPSYVVHASPLTYIRTMLEFLVGQGEQGETTKYEVLAGESNCFTESIPSGYSDSNWSS